MELPVGQTLLLLDEHRQTLGRIILEQHEGDLLCGRFEPTSAFATTEPLFREFESAANDQALGRIDTLDRDIAALQLRLGSTDGMFSLPIHDLQLWSDSSISCRLPTGATLATFGSLNGEQRKQRL